MAEFDRVHRVGKHHWYFWDEAYCRHGPFKRRRQASRALIAYARTMLEGLVPRSHKPRHKMRWHAWRKQVKPPKPKKQPKGEQT